MNAQLQKVDYSTLSKGDKVYFDFTGSSSFGGLKFDKTFGLFEGFDEYKNPSFRTSDGVKNVDRDCVYYPPTPPTANAPVLIELEKLLTELRGRKMHGIANDLEYFYGKPENQYQVQQEKPVEWVPELGDICKSNRSGKLFKVIDYKPYDTFPVKVVQIETGRENAYWLWDVTLVKKAEKPTVIKSKATGIEYDEKGEPITSNVNLFGDHPLGIIDLATTAKEINTNAETFAIGDKVRPYLQDPKTGNWLQSCYFTEQKDLVGKEGTIEYIDMLGNLYVHGWPWLPISIKKVKDEKELPMKWEDLGMVAGSCYDEDARLITKGNHKAAKSQRSTYPTKQDADSALAMSQLLQFRKAWLEILHPDWVPDYSENSQEFKYSIYRESQKVKIVGMQWSYHQLSFPTQELAYKFKDTFINLINTAFNLPTSETISGTVTN